MLCVAALGLNAWAVILVVPAAAAKPSGLSFADIDAITMPLAVLALGLWFLRRRGRTVATASVGSAATWLLLGCFPASLALATIGVTAVDAPWAQSGVLVAVAVGALSLACYGAYAAAALSRPSKLREVRVRELGTNDSPGGPEHRRRRVQRLLLIGTTTGACAVAVLGPLVPVGAALEAARSQTTREVSLVAAIAAGGVGAAMIGFFVGPALRAPRRSTPPRRNVALRVAACLVVAATGAAAYVLLLRADGS